MHDQARDPNDRGESDDVDGSDLLGAVHADATARAALEERVALLEFTDRRALDDAALALAAQGHAWAVVALPDPTTGRQRFVLTVPREEEAAARDELAAYAGDLRRRRGVEPLPEPIDSGAAGALGYAFLIGLVYLFERRGAFGLDWREAGVNASDRVFDGELWRSITSLFLHADVPHLASNLFFGVLFGVLLAHAVGSGLAWSSILVAGAIGNLANDAFQAGVHRSIGASTAVFAAVGLLVGVESIRRRRFSVGPARRFGPIMLGAVLLAWFGGAGGQEGSGRSTVDVGAHVMGFVSGLSLSGLLAVIAARVPLRDVRVQTAGGALACALALAAWAVALGT